MIHLIVLLVKSNYSVWTVDFFEETVFCSLEIVFGLSSKNEGRLAQNKFLLKGINTFYTRKIEKLKLSGLKLQVPVLYKIDSTLFK